ncbi:MAG TPA: carboxypeptidase-like regulatory domain-containing protein [Kofleriaceae bacterium]|nr:carboxypeptidase-like regulatory domain-containing protein [Kofleriaceae bacterium]
MAVAMGAGSRSVAVALVAAAGVTPLAVSRPAVAQQPAGDSTGALPGFVRVGAAGPFDTGFVLSGLAGYGYRGAVVAESDRHHRAAFDVATSFRPRNWLAIAARYSGRYDRHTGTGTGDEGEWVGDPRLAVRASAPLGSELWLAAQAGLWVPGREGSSLEPDAASVDLIGLATWAPPASRFSLGVEGGFRLDRSAEAIDRPEELSASDRMSLEVSESDAILMGAGASMRTGATEWVGEWSWDALVGDRAPDAREWPMRLGAGMRRQLTRTVGLQLLVEVSLSRTRDPVVLDPLFPIEPRFQAMAGITLAPGREEPGRAPVRPAREPTGGSIAGAWIVVSVVDAAGAPIAGADVVVLPSGGSGTEVRMGRTDARGRVTFDGIDGGLARIEVSHVRHRASSRLLEVEPGRTSNLRFALSRALPPGQLRGLVRSLSGRPLAAELAISPLGTRTRSDAHGEFEIDLPPGEYEVSVEAEGYRAQRRRIHIEQDGVTILNVDLRK